MSLSRRLLLLFFVPFLLVARGKISILRQNSLNLLRWDAEWFSSM
jgi:hypothetical protein